MSDITEFTPDWCMHPGELLAEVLEERGLRQSELAGRTGLSAKHINQIIKKSVGISPDVAILLERALGELFLLAARAEQVDPDRIVRQQILKSHRYRRKRSVRAHISRDHCLTSFGERATLGCNPYFKRPNESAPPTFAPPRWASTPGISGIARQKR